MNLKISEHQHQKAVIQWARIMEHRYTPLKWMYAIPNGGARHIVAARKLKAEGVKAGVPDLCLPYPIVYNGGKKPLMCGEVTQWHGLYIEMKTKGGAVNPDQKEWIKYLLSVGYMVAVCWTAEEAIQELTNYLEGTTR